MLQGKKKAKQKKKKVMAADIAFFVKLRCNAALEEEEEGDGSNVAIACFVALQRNSTT